MTRSCFCPGCKSGYKSDNAERKRNGQKVPSMFGTPKNTGLFEKWKKAIPRADKELSSSHYVCSLHFKEEDLDMSYEVRLSDGTIWREKKVRPTLKENAVPSIFPNLPKYLTVLNKRRKLPVVRDNLLSSTSLLNEQADVTSNVITDMNVDQPKLSFAMLKKHLEQKHMKAQWSQTVTDNFVAFLFWASDHCLERYVVITENLDVKVFLKGVETDIGHNFQLASLESVFSLLKKVESCLICAGVDNEKENCLGYLQGKMLYRKSRCKNCLLHQKKIFMKKYTHSYLLSKKRQYIACALRRNERLKTKVGKLENEILSARKECAVAKQDSFDELISGLPQNQQQSIATCLKAARCKKKGMRYSYQWIYECLLIKIKSTKTYNHLRSHHLLKLPSPSTLYKYLKNIKGCYGFQPVIFKCLKQKADAMEESDRHGSLLIDEMKLSPTLVFDRQTLEIHGFTDLGKYTPRKQITEKGDHALVLMFQPFRGKWVQSIACFLSKGAASGTVLHHIVIECITLLEQSGFFVDAVVTDGATWNRKMWGTFGINVDSVSCEHIYDPNRRLWFVSDFPHLLKNLRNSIVKNKITMTPDGPVDIKFWDAVIECDMPSGFNLKVCPKLTPDHVRPKHFQKMNVAMAFQFFSASTAAGMAVYKKSNSNLHDSDGCIIFIERINKLIDCMNARTPFAALKLNSISKQAIQDFIYYLNDWKNFSIKKNYHFITDSTYCGLKVTLKATLEIAEYLIVKCNFSYLMTARLNQDSLERFFGIMRNACGSNDHPNSSVFLQIFRLIGTYSLIKPPVNSNVAGSEMVQSLLDIRNLDSATSNKAVFEEKLDAIVDKGTNLVEMATCLQNFNDHDYCQGSSNDVIVGYFAGYVARKAQKFTCCESCKNLLINDDTTANILISKKSNGGLIAPSLTLFHLINLLESATMKTVNSISLNVHTLNNLYDCIEQLTLPLIGCVNHQHCLTFSVINFFVITRMHFLCKRANKIDIAKTNKTKEHRKLSKLS